jgi:uncharacterized pyridoxal phosphate-containing UPF0001 family protein
VKHGVEPGECVDLARFILEQCPHLKLGGLMTIGLAERDGNQQPNPDFVVSVDETLEQGIHI